MTLEDDLVPFTLFIAIPAAVAGATFGLTAFSTVRRLLKQAQPQLAAFLLSLRPRAASVLVFSPRGATVVCPYCKDAIFHEGVRVECAACATWHHPMCFEENVGCAVFGCSERRGHGVVRDRAR